MDEQESIVFEVSHGWHPHAENHMGFPAMDEELLEELAGLRDEDKRRVLEFARALARTTPAGRPGRDLLGHAGTVPSEELDRMAEAIEEGCEQVG